jgi:hypothetical protein
VVTERTLIRARAGDEDAIRELTDPYRRELQLHRSRILGSLQDAEDLLQETLFAASRGLERRIPERPSARGVPLRLVATRANGQPAFSCYLPDPQAAIAHAYGLLALTLKGDRISAITWFFDRGLFPNFGLPRTLHE